MKTAFVTGATGFIGGAFARRLLADGWKVRCLVRDPSRARDLEAEGAILVQGDVTRPDTLVPGMKGVDAVFHAAAYVDLVKPDREPLMAANVAGTENVLAAAKALKIPRVVHFSSVAAIGRKHEQADESVFNDGDYAGLYEESKHRAEEVALRFGREGLDVVHVLPCVVLGPGDPKSGAFFKRYLRRQIPAVPAKDGTASFVFIDDLVDGILLAYQKGKTNERYIFTQVTWTTSEVMRELEAATGIPAPRRIPVWVALAGAAFEEGRARIKGRPPAVSRAAVRLATKRFGYSSAKARRELGWKPADFGPRFRSVVSYWQREVERETAHA